MRQPEEAHLRQKKGWWKQRPQTTTEANSHPVYMLLPGKRLVKETGQIVG